jgi:HSP20 family protein
MDKLMNNTNREFFKDLLSPVLVNGFNHVFNEEDSSERNFIPASNIKEGTASYEVVLALPGLSKKDVEIEVKEGLLNIKGAYNKEEVSEGEKYHKREVHTGNFSRSFRLGNNVDLSAVEAQFVDGLLRISIPKREKEIAKKVTIK